MDVTSIGLWKQVVRGLKTARIAFCYCSYCPESCAVMKSRKWCLVVSGVSFLWMLGGGGKASLTVCSFIAWTWASTVGGERWALKGRFMKGAVYLERSSKLAASGFLFCFYISGTASVFK